MCHQCHTLGGLKISFRGQAVPCDCPAGDRWRQAGRREAEADKILGLRPEGQSIVEPWTETGRTVLHD